MIVSPVAAAGSDCSSGGGDIVAGTKEIFSYIACVYVVCVSRVGDRDVTTFEGGDKVTIEQERQEIGDTREKQGRDEGEEVRMGGGILPRDNTRARIYRNHSGRRVDRGPGSRNQVVGSQVGAIRILVGR